MINEWGNIDLKRIDLDKISSEDLDVDWCDIYALVKSIRNERAVSNALPVYPRKKQLHIDSELLDIEVTEAYQTVLNVIRGQEPLILAYGKAGTGKSTLIRYIRQQMGENVAVLAPTGIAALNAGGQTIHSFCQFPPQVITGECIKEVSTGICRSLDLLIIDEISMVRVDLLDGVDRFLRVNGRDPFKPFGGVPVLMVGDFYQLPPVVATDEERAYLDETYGSPYFFFAKLFEHVQPFVVELDKIFRQSDPLFVKMLNDIRSNNHVKESIEGLNNHCFSREGVREAFITLTCTNKLASSLNTAKMELLPGEMQTYQSYLEGKASWSSGRLPAPERLILKPGAQVMFSKNDVIAKRWVNGTLGVVVSLGSKTICVKLCHGPQAGECVSVVRETWEQIRYRYNREKGCIKAEVVGTYTQFPLMPAWAVTIHKAQGQTYNHVTVDLGQGAFASGQLYVALSRCRTLEGLRLSRPIRESDVICDPVIQLLDRFLATKVKNQ